MGVNAYLQQAFKTEASTAELNAEQIDLINSLPAWMTALFAIAVFAGIIGCIALLMRKKMAVNLFAISFVAATIQQLYWLFGTNAVALFSEMQPYLMPVLIIVFAAFLVWYAKDQYRKGILS
jgi:hypothetical protein